MIEVAVRLHKRNSLYELMRPARLKNCSLHAKMILQCHPRNLMIALEILVGSTKGDLLFCKASAPLPSYTKLR